MRYYREGAKGYCYHCGRPKEEHSKSGECPPLEPRVPNDREEDHAEE